PGAARFLQAGDIPSPGEDGEEDFSLNSVETWSGKPVIAPLYEPRLIHSENITLAMGAAVSGLEVGEDGRVRALHLKGRGDLPTPNEVVLAAGGLETARLLLTLRKEHPTLFGGADGPLGRFYQGHLTGYLTVAHLDNEEIVRQLS